MEGIYKKTFKVDDVTFTNDDISSRQDILAQIKKQQESGAPDPKFRFENTMHEGSESVAVYIDDKKVGFITKNNAAWLIEHMDEAESIDSFEITNNGQYDGPLGLSLVVSFKAQNGEQKAAVPAFVMTEPDENKRQDNVVVCHSCGKETALDKECRHCGAPVIRTGGGIFAENWAMLIGFAFLVGIYIKLGLGISVAAVSASMIIAYAAAATFFALLQLNTNKQRLQQAYCVLIHEPFKFRPWYVLYGVLGLIFVGNFIFTI